MISEIAKSIERHLLAGGYSAKVERDIIELLAQLSKFDKANTQLQNQVKCHRDDLLRMRTYLPRPVCFHCKGNMVYASALDLFVCYCRGKCHCHGGADETCDFCDSMVEPYEFWENRALGNLAPAKQRAVAASIKETGPSAVAAAKPVTPRYEVACMGDWCDDNENL